MISVLNKRAPIFVADCVGRAGRLAVAEIYDVRPPAAPGAMGFRAEAGSSEAALEARVRLFGPDSEDAARSQRVACARERARAVERIVGRLGRGVRTFVEVEQDRVVDAARRAREVVANIRD